MKINQNEEPNTDEMTVEELRAYYDAGGASRLQKMSDNEQADMFRKFTVSQIWSELIVAEYDTFTVLCLFISFPVGGSEEAQVGRTAPATSDLESKEANCPA